MSAYFPSIAKLTASASVDWGTLYLIDATAGVVSLTLPPVAVMRAPIWLKKTDSSANAVKFVTADSTTIDGASGATGLGVSTQNFTLSLISDGVNWYRMTGPA
jgi:hypothetical protein